MPRDANADPAALRQTIERALRRDDEASSILPMLERLQRIAQEGSDERTYADRRLAELLLETHPWRAALHLRRLLAIAPEEHPHWAMMGLAQALLGNHHFACRAYRQALARDPGNPWYSHNLGHLLDVAFDRLDEALPHLERAFRRVREEPAVVCSYVHALIRGGDLRQARKHLRPLLVEGSGVDPDVVALATELERCERATHKRKPRVAAPEEALSALFTKATTGFTRARQRRAKKLLEAWLLTLDAKHAGLPSGRGDNAMTVGTALLALAYVEGESPLPYDAVARVCGGDPIALKKSFRQAARELGLVPDSRTRARRRTL